MLQTHKEIGLTKFIAAISNADRLKIISSISQQNDSITQIADKLNANPADLCNHPEILERAILSQFHPDTTTLRRFLVDFGFLVRERDGSWYSRVEE